MTFYVPYIHPICELAVYAGKLIMGYYNSGDYESARKEDDSPVTQADVEANNIILRGLAHFSPDIPVVSEEGDKPVIAFGGRFWLVDPLDGTESFIRKSDEFTVNIALIDEGRPVFGALYIPVKDTLYYGSTKYGAFRQKSKDAPRKIFARAQPEEGAHVVVSMMHKNKKVDEWLEDKSVAKRFQASSSLKFGLVAEGTADLYPRFGRTMEWDTAAGQAIVEAAGGSVLTMDGQSLHYGKPGYENPGFVVYGKRVEI